MHFACPNLNASHSLFFNITELITNFSITNCSMLVHISSHSKLFPDIKNTVKISKRFCTEITTPHNVLQLPNLVRVKSKPKTQHITQIIPDLFTNFKYNVQYEPKRGTSLIVYLPITGRCAFVSFSSAQEAFKALQLPTDHAELVLLHHTLDPLFTVYNTIHSSFIFKINPTMMESVRLP